MSARAAAPVDIDWQRIYDYVLACGMEHDPLRFCVRVLEEAGELAPYDQGLMYFLDENRRVQAQHLVNIRPRWSNMYLEYFSQVQGAGRGLHSEANETFGEGYVHQISWPSEPRDEFLTNYIMARGVKSSLVFVLFDPNSMPRAAFSLDRTRSERFSRRRYEAMRLAVTQLNNLFKNFFTDPDAVPGRHRGRQDAMLDALLTPREREVVELLCQGLPPAHVAAALHISTSTAYKHVAHIHKKLNVSSQQELLVRVLGNR